MSKERWIPIEGFVGMYSVSSLGRIKSHKRKGCGNDRILKTHDKGNTIDLYSNGVAFRVAVKGLVREMFND